MKRPFLLLDLCRSREITHSQLECSTNRELALNMRKAARIGAFDET